MKKQLSSFLSTIGGFCIVIALVAIFMFLVLPLPATAGLGNPSSTTVVVNGTVTTNDVAQVSLEDSSSVSVHVVTTSSAANTSNTVISIDQSTDGTNWKSTGKTITIANTGTTAANVVSNWTGLADRQWRFNVENGALSGVTNTVVITPFKKPGI